MEDLLQHSRDENLSNILFVHHKFFTYKMQEGDDLLDHVNKVKALTDQLACLEVPVRDENIIMTLLESLSALYEYLITALETMPMKRTYDGLCDNVMMLLVKT